MVEKFHEDIIANARAERDRQNGIINDVNELARNGTKYKPTEKTALVDSIKARMGTAAKDYKGNPRPPRQPRVDELDVQAPGSN